MNELQVIMFKSDCGDSFLVTIIGINEINILIDCGTRDTYLNYIKPKLIEMNNNNKVLDFVILSHMHDDHIGGAIEFFKENESNDISKIIKVKNVIYNGIKGLKIENYEEIECNQNDKMIYEGIIANGNATLKKKESSNNISMKQDVFLSRYITKGGYKWNDFNQFTDDVVYISGNKLPKLELDKNTSMTFISPNFEDLKNLNSSWETYLKHIRKKIKIVNSELAQNAYEAFLFLISSSEGEQIIKQISQNKVINIDDVKKLSNEVIEQDNKKYENGSSIAFILTFENRNLLFLGDSFSKTYLNNLLEWKKKSGIKYFDMIKVSHHGSKFNTSDDFLKNFDSPLYLISTNGKHGHPDIETIAKIINRKINFNKKNIDKRTIISSNKTNSIEMFNRKNIKDEFKFEVQYLSNEPIKLFDELGDK